jgi:tRNA G46 methylase TrmB
VLWLLVLQVESFALLLWQLIQHHPLSAASHHSSSTTTTSSSDTSSTGTAPAAAAADSSTNPPPLHVVEFGSGSGNLILPLAHLFPAFSFTAVDMKPSAVGLLQQRVEQAGLTNVTALLGRIEDYTGVG